MTRLGPGCECQPKDPTGAIEYCRTWRSESPLVLTRACQAGETVFAPISSNCPTAKVVVVTPEGGVASAVALDTATPTTANRSDTVDRLCIGSVLSWARR